jgi:hypothetical protein
MPLPLPKKVGIGRYTFRIRELSAKKADKLKIDGICDFANSRIGIRFDGHSNIEHAIILLHEMLHGCWEVTDLGDEPDEETAVDKLSTMLVQTMRDNPDVWAYLMEKARK